MNAFLVIWSISVGFLAALAAEKERCDDYGAVVHKPDRQCICDRTGFVKCEVPSGGRDFSAIHEKIRSVFEKVAEKKKKFRDWYVGRLENLVNDRIDIGFDPPEFTMTTRPAIKGGIGGDGKGFGETDVGGNGVADSTEHGDTGEIEYDDDEEKLRRLKHHKKRNVTHKHRNKHKSQHKGSANPKLRSLSSSKKHQAPKNKTKLHHRNMKHGNNMKRRNLSSQKMNGKHNVSKQHPKH